MQKSKDQSEKHTKEDRRHYSGSNAFPPYWKEVKKLFWQFVEK